MSNDCFQTQLPCLIILGRIEEKCNSNGDRLDKIEKRIRPIELDFQMTQRAASRAGGKWGAIIGAIIAALGTVAARAMGG
jgi:hypothetical protein